METANADKIRKKARKYYNHRIENHFRAEQRDAIKDKLINCFNDACISFNKLKDDLNESSDFEINYTTLYNTLNKNKNTLDIYCVIALCRYFNLDISYVLSEPNDPVSEILYENSKYTSEAFSKLTGNKYIGVHYGYLYSPNKSCDFIDSFRLEIIRERGQTVARLRIQSNTTDKSGNIVRGVKTLSGKPTLVKPHNIYIPLHDSLGNCYIFSFSYIQYNVLEIYYRRGIAITQSQSTARTPLVQSFVIFDRPVSIENMELIKGLLLLNDDAFHIPASELERLISENQDIANLYEKAKYVFEGNKEEYYLIDELQILHSLKRSTDKINAIRLLQIMKANATDAERIFLYESDEYSEFSKLIHKIDEES